MPELPSIVELIVQSPLCLDCLEKKTGVSVADAEDVIRRIQSVLAITVASAHCEGCLRTTTTYQIGQPVAARAVRMGPTSVTPALWRFLIEHRGEMFCALCLATALGTARRLGRVLFMAEGRGARRQHGKCSRCGKDRLLCGLAR
jgi:hypothetical protein